MKEKVIIKKSKAQKVYFSPRVDMGAGGLL